MCGSLHYHVLQLTELEQRDLLPQKPRGRYLMTKPIMKTTQMMKILHLKKDLKPLITIILNICHG